MLVFYRYRAEAETDPRLIHWWLNRSERAWGFHRPDEHARVAALRAKASS